MPDWPYIAAALAAVTLAALLFHAYRVQKSTLLRVLHFISALSEGQYARRTDPTGKGPAGDLAREANALAEKLEAHSAQAQQDSDHLFSLLAVLDHTNEIALATDSSDNIRLANPAAARVLGRQAGELLGKPIDAVLANPQLVDLYRNAFHSMGPVSAQVTLQTQWGGERALHCQATAATIYNGAHYRGTLLLLRDVAEIARTLQIKTDFVANASHELRTPLASILAAAGTVVDSGADGQEAINGEATKRCIQIIHNHALRLEMIITDLLDLSRAEEPGAAVRADPIDLAQVADQVISIYAAAAAEKHVVLRVDLAPDAQSLRGDERLLHLTLKNLLDNAVKFTSNGSVTIRSYAVNGALPAGRLLNGSLPAAAPGLAAAPPERALVVEVQDTGCGIPAEDQQRVFERFYTVNRSRGGADRGTGLGLAIVKHAVAAMGGSVSLVSEVGRGTTLRCHFPLVAEAPAGRPRGM